MKDYESEVSKLWLKKFKKSNPGEQYRLLDIMHEINPVKPSRSRGEKEELPESIKKKQRLDLIKKSYMKA